MIVYASRTGNVQSLVDSLGLEAKNISEADGIGEDYILFTYTDGAGDIPYEVDDFLAKNSSHLKGVVASGDYAYGDDNFCASGDKIAEMYGVPCLYKVENSGTDEDIAKLLDILK